jgi:hypothetical protein
MDLDLIKQEIEKEKKKKGQLSEQIGVNIPSDDFLYNLQQSLATGQPSKATAKLQVVNERSKNMNVDPVTKQVSNHNRVPVNEDVLRQMGNVKHNVNPNPQNNEYYPPQQGGGRDAQFNNMVSETIQPLNSNNNNAGIADAMAMYQNQPQVGQPQNQGMITNPNYLVEQVNNAVQTYMATTNMAQIIEVAVKNTMMEIYQKEKVEEAINENKGLIGKIVMETLIELKNKGNTKK